MHAQLVRHLALALVGEVAAELLVHVGQRVKEALLGLPRGEWSVVGEGRLFIKEDRDDIGARDVLEIRDHPPQHRGQTRVPFASTAEHGCRRITTRMPRVPWKAPRRLTATPL